MRKSELQRLSAAFALAVALAAPAGAQTQAYTPGEALCRDNLYASTHLLAGAILGEMAHCHRFRMLDRDVPAATNCNDTASLPRQKAIVRFEAHLRDRVKSNCTEAGTPAALAYPSTCPAPCNSVTIANFDDVGECAICLARNAAERMMTDAYHTPAVSGPGDEVKCQSKVGAALAASARQRIRQQRVCQEIQDLGRTSFNISDATDCQVDDVTGKVKKSEDKARHSIAACKTGAVANIQSCGDTVAELQTCAELAVRRAVDELYNFVYPNRASPAPLQAFVTSGTFSGKSIGDVSGANAICENAALTAGLTGTFSAWISTHTGGVGDSSPSTTFVSNGLGYERIDGELIAASFADLTDGSLLTPLNVDELGAVIGIGAQDVWTSTTANGSPFIAGTADEDNCGHWGATGEGGFAGRAYATDSTWTLDSDFLCTDTLRLYCFEQAN